MTQENKITINAFSGNGEPEQPHTEAPFKSGQTYEKRATPVKKSWSRNCCRITEFVESVQRAENLQKGQNTVHHTTPHHTTHPAFVFASFARATRTVPGYRRNTPASAMCTIATDVS